MSAKLTASRGAEAERRSGRRDREVHRDDVELANDKARLTWKLTFAHLSGPGIAAHIHIGKVGKAGPVALALCGPCNSGQTGKGMLTHAQVAKIEAG